MEIDFDALIARTKLALSQKEPESYLEPYRDSFCFQFLTNSPVGRLDFLGFHHLYLDSDEELYYDARIIVHGHKIDLACFAPCFCHQYGYWPSNLTSPRFRKQFNMKWEQTYKEKGWKING